MSGVRTIKNRDVFFLARVSHAMEEIEHLENRRQWERDRRTNITQHLSWTHGGGAKGGAEESMEAISELEEKHEEKVREYRKMVREAEAILMRVPDGKLRILVSMAYYEQAPEKEIRREFRVSHYLLTQAEALIEAAESMEKVDWESVSQKIS